VKKNTLLILLLLIGLPPLNAIAQRYEVAAQLQELGKHEEALVQFVALSAIGNKDAQFSVAAMNFNGQGTKKDYIEGYAWMTIAASKGSEQAQGVLDKFASKLSPEQLAQAKLRHDELVQTYGDAAIHKNLMPTETLNNTRGNFRDRKPLRKPTAKYPKEAERRYLDGQTLISFTVGADGRTRNQRVTSYTSDLFIKPSLISVKGFLYQPSKIGDVPVPVYSVSNRFTFQMIGGNGEYKQKALVKVLSEAKSKVEHGSSHDRYEYAFLAEGLRQYLSDENRTLFNDAHKWNTAAAIDGHPFAKFDLGTRILYGEQCDADSSKSHFWLKSAAQDGVSEAQLLLGLERYNGVMFEKDEAIGLDWIRKAATNGNEFAKVQFAQLVTLNPQSDDKILAEARVYLNDVKLKDLIDKLSYHEANAALYSREGNFKKARKFQKKALKEAKKYKLPTALMEKNMQGLQENKVITQLIDTSNT